MGLAPEGFEELVDQPGIANVLDNIGVVYRKQGEDRRRVKRYEKRKRELEDRLVGLSEDTSLLFRYVQYGMSLLAGLLRYYQSAGIEAKDRIISSIFPGKLVF